MTENQKLREALQAISHIDDATSHSADASAALDHIGQIARQALALPTPAEPVEGPADGWLQDKGLLYRLTDDRNPKNRDEINVTMADGSRSDASRTRRAGELLDRIRSIKAEPVEGGEVDQARFDAGCDVLKYLRQEGAPPRITNLMLVCLHGDPERTAPPARQGVIDLKSGEHYAGIALDAEGEHRHHLILLPGDVDMTWGKAREWASSIGGELPTRQEQSILFANLKGKFEQAYYWSNEQLASYTGYAWSQGFHDGYQINTSKGSELRARAVRRVPIHRKAA